MTPAEALAALEAEVVRPHAADAALCSCLRCGARGTRGHDSVQHQPHCPVVIVRDALADADVWRYQLERMQELAREGSRKDVGRYDVQRARDQLLELAGGAV